MKIRSGFVSNSSSSSFVCDVCNENVSGMDMGLSDAEMFSCKDGHTICDEHMVGAKYHDLNFKKKRAYLLGAEYYSDDTDRINEATEENDLDIIYEEGEYDLRYEMPIEHCPCCTLDEVSDDQIVDFLLYEAKTTPEKVAKKIKKTFKNYQEMKKVLEK